MSLTDPILIRQTSKVVWDPQCIGTEDSIPEKALLGTFFKRRNTLRVPHLANQKASLWVFAKIISVRLYYQDHFSFH